MGCDSFCVKAPAKVNLFLEVLKKRDDGYHDIRSLIVPVSLFDEVTVEKSESKIETVLNIGDQFNHEAMQGLSSEDNLTTRVAHLLKARTGPHKEELYHPGRNPTVCGLPVFFEGGKAPG